MKEGIVIVSSMTQFLRVVNYFFDAKLVCGRSLSCFVSLRCTHAQFGLWSLANERDSVCLTSVRNYVLGKVNTRRCFNNTILAHTL